MASALHSDPFKTELSRLGLNEDPFQLSADPRYLYLGEEHQAVFETIKQVIQKRRGLALVTGKPGTGKSSLARFTFDRLFGNGEFDVAYIDTSNFDTRTAAAKKISQSFGTIEIETGRSYSEQMELLEQGIAGAYKKGHIVVLLLDDAQKLKRFSLELLHELYNFDFGEKAMNVIAFGEESAVKNFYNYPSISSRLYTIQSLKPISYETTIQMVGFRLSTAAGGKTLSIFTDSALQKLYETSAGIPRDVVILGSMALDKLIQTGGVSVGNDLMTQVAEDFTAQRNLVYGQ